MTPLLIGALSFATGLLIGIVLGAILFSGGYEE